MDLSFIFYVFLCIVATTGGSFYYYSRRQEITAVIFFFGLAAFSVVFGLRWFTETGQRRAATASGTWPPVINYCPDFLTLHKTTGTNPVHVCIDTIGVARQGGMSKFTDATNTGTQYHFNLHLDKSGDARIKAICDECAAKKVTWEGVHTGSICLNVEPPVPSTRSA